MPRRLPQFAAAGLMAGLLIANVVLPAHAGGDARVSITFTGLKSAAGDIRVALFASEDGYANGKTEQGQTVKAADGATVTFDGLKPGEYAFKIFHDENGNGTLDSNIMGIPTEPYAFSNNAHGHFGPASWADAHFAVHDGANAQIITLE